MGREESKEQAKEAAKEKEGVAAAKKAAQRDKQWEQGAKVGLALLSRVSGWSHGPYC
jgi:hypothetical protein